MSDFVQRDILSDLWNEVLKRHWTYLDTEESLVKLENRKKLEVCLKEYLCIIQHDRKFFLPETAKVLRNSIRDLEDFSAQKAITAFEYISQYANNLFTKPWRKEFRILKMYSGFYQHEIKSNLLDAEELFEAMGYRRLSEDTLILDFAICPDQVTNVSRDAMIAYVELQIIKHIYSGLNAIGINCSWFEIFRYREKCTGGTSQAVEDLAYSIEEKRVRSRQKLLAGDNYGYIDVQPSSNYLANKIKYCPSHCQCNFYQQPMSRHRATAQLNDICCVPEHHKKSLRAPTNTVYSNTAYHAQNLNQQNHHYHNHPEITSDGGGVSQPQMSHSRSLEHYSEPVNHHHNILPHRHSFDHQQQGCTAHYHHLQHQQQHHFYQHLNQPQQNLYESPYECIDVNSMGGGSSSISYAAVAANAGAGKATASDGGIINSNSTYSHPYNVSGNRIPLPLNISSQFSAYDNLQTSNYMGCQDPNYGHITDHQMYSSVSKIPQNCIMNTNAVGYNHTSNHVHGLPSSQIVKDSFQRQRSCQTEALINFDDSVTLPSHAPQQKVDPPNQYCTNNETSNNILDKHIDMGNIMENPLPPTTTNCQQHYVPGKPTSTNDMYVYAKPTPKENRKPQQQTALNIRKYPYSSGERGDTTDLSYESANDDFVDLSGQENERITTSSPTQFTKNQDGVGSFESWSYVFQNLERSGYSKDLGERKDLLVQSLDLDSLNINNDTSPSQSSSAEKKRSNFSGNESKITKQHQHQQQIDTNKKSRTIENSKYSAKNNKKVETISSINNSEKQKNSMDNNAKKIKSALKQTNATSKPNTYQNHQTIKTQPKTNDNKTTNKTLNNNNNDSLTNSGNGTTQRKQSSTASSSMANTTRKTTNAPPPISTQIIVTGANEWSCSFCTFINPNSKRICEICYHSKDFHLDSSTTTSESTVTHNTPTCA